MRKDEEVQRAVEAFRRAVDTSNQPSVTVSPPPSAFNPPSAPKQNGRATPYPPIQAKESISHYTDRELRNLLAWVQSDGRLRTNEEIADEMFAALPFSRRGSKIEEALTRTIQSWERTQRKQV